MGKALFSLSIVESCIGQQVSKLQYLFSDFLFCLLVCDGGGSGPLDPPPASAAPGVTHFSQPCLLLLLLLLSPPTKMQLRKRKVKV